jgi:hypothetical protein
MGVAARLGLVCVLLASVGSRDATADSTKLAEARGALDAVRYDAAQKLLVEALHEGGNSPATVAEIYRLSASTAIVLGQRDIAEQYYRRWLAIDPRASMPDTVAPKLSEPFVAAQAYMAARGRLTASAARRTPTEVEIAIESDPLAMAKAVAIDASPPQPLGAERSARVTIAAAASGAAVAVLDEFGNHLIELGVGAAPAEPAIGPAPDPTTWPVPSEPFPGPVDSPRPSRWRDWRIWAVSAGVVWITGFAFGMVAFSRDEEVEDIVREPSKHFYPDLDAARTARDNYATTANVAYLGAALLTGVTVVMFVTRPQPRAMTVAPTASPGAFGVALTGAF